MNQAFTTLDTTLNTVDAHGNRLLFDSETGNIYFAEVNKKQRNIGYITYETMSDELVYHKLEDEQQIYRKLNSWSINNEVLKQVDSVEYVTAKGTYVIARAYAYAHGIVGTHKTSILDKKIFVPLQFWEIEFDDPLHDSVVQKLGYEWYEELVGEFYKPYMIALNNFLMERSQYAMIAPEREDIYNAYRLTPQSQVKVVIIGQDPYHTPGVAHGLAFSTQKALTLPPSLKNIFKELETDVYNGLNLNDDADLIRWAHQGVFLLNTVLTVEVGQPNSHKNRGWETFTAETIKRLNQNNKDVVYLLWGLHAKSYAHLINHEQNLVLEAAHPSPFSAHKGFFGCKHFSKTNSYLQSVGKEPIQW